jgi:hypothetical protein
MDISLQKAQELIQVLPDTPQAELFVRIDEITDILVAQDNKGGHVEAHLQLLRQNEDQQPVIDEYIQRLQVNRAAEAQLEQALKQLRDQAIQLSGDTSIQNEELRHLKETNQEKERHLATTNNIQFAERLQKTQAKLERSQDKHQQTLRHKEEEAALKLTEKTLEIAADANKQSDNGPEGGQ